MDHARMKSDAAEIFAAGVASVDPRPMVRNALRLDGSTLSVGDGADAAVYDLKAFDRVTVIGYGKAGARMAQGAEDALGGLISDGVVAVKKGHAEPCVRVRIIEAAHPLPDGSSVEAATELISVARGADERTLAIVLVSGGGSSILCAPYDGHGRRLSLEAKAAVTRELLACGADIRQINAVRRHLSAVKGGRLAEALAPATVVALVLSDVVGDDLSSIASGPTVPDPTTWDDALGIVRRFGIEGRIPPEALDLLADGAAGRLPDTPKPGDDVFGSVRHFVLGSNRRAAAAAAAKARELGYSTVGLGSRITGEAREIGRAYLGVALECVSAGLPQSPPACVIAGGETTVTLRGPGKGGRNQEMALSFLLGLAEAEPALADRVCFLSAGTDGNDGPTDAAGAFADLDLLAAAEAAGLKPAEYLAANDSYTFFDSIGGLLRTGPTNTNVCDLQVALAR